jgi:hypothetical protein
MLKYLRKIRKSYYFILALLITIIFFTQMCTSRHDAESGQLIFDSYGQAFAGSASCQPCHSDIFKSHINTAHYLDSRPASAAYIKGRFDSGHNYFVYPNGSEVDMRCTRDGSFQTGLKNGRQFRNERIDIVIGSGRKGQGYLYWKGDGLFQLPVSYYTPTDSWVNSPGYVSDSAVFDRRIPASCLECHSTYARTVFEGQQAFGDYFDKSRIIYGIDCERCHGPGTEHIEYHKQHPGETAGKYIVNTERLSRQQKLDACALCHSGSRYPSKPPFSFKVGDRLDDFSEAKYMKDSVANLDVHGNQYGLLTSSKCFIRSAMDCSSCHNVHKNEAGEIKLFSQRCMNCHNQPAHNTCTMPQTPGLVLGDNCIDCHMPALLSKRIVLEHSYGNDTARSNSNAVAVRTHHIAIYPASTKAYLFKLFHRG